MKSEQIFRSVVEFNDDNTCDGFAAATMGCALKDSNHPTFGRFSIHGVVANSMVSIDPCVSRVDRCCVHRRADAGVPFTEADSISR